MSIHITLRPGSPEAHRAADIARQLVRAMRIGEVEYEQSMFEESMEEKKSEPFFRLLEAVMVEALNDINFLANLVASLSYLVHLTMQVGLSEPDRLAPGRTTASDRERADLLLDLVADLTAKNGAAYLW